MGSTLAQYAEKEADYFGRSRSEIEPLLPDHMERVLEIGCGAGGTMAWIRRIRNVSYAVGIELFEDAAARAASVFNEVHVGDAHVMVSELEASGFDVILALDVLEHLTNPWSVVECLSRKLKPGGVLIVSIPNIGHYSVAAPLLLRGKWNYQPSGLLDLTHLRFFVMDTAKALVEAGGCRVERIVKVREAPSFMARIPDRFYGPAIRWHTRRLMGWLPGWRLLDMGYLISARQGAAPR